MMCTIIGGASGSISGGVINDLLKTSSLKIGKVSFSGLKGGLVILIACLTVAAPIMAVAFWLPLPQLFGALYVAYFIVEMWFRYILNS